MEACVECGFLSGEGCAVDDTSVRALDEGVPTMECRLQATVLEAVLQGLQLVFFDLSCLLADAFQSSGKIG